MSSTISTIVSPNKEIHIISYIYIYMSSFHICVSLAVTNCLLQISVANHQSHETCKHWGGSLLVMPIFHMTVYICDSNFRLLSYKIKNKTHHGDWTSSFNYFFCILLRRKTHTTFSSKDIQLKIPCFASSTIICLVLLKSPIDKTPNISFNAEFQFGFLSMDFCCANLLRFTY